jgi:hypothetical protein
LEFVIWNLFGIWCLEFVILVKYPGQTHLISAQRSDGVFLLETYRILLAKTGIAMIKPVLF